MSKIIVSEFMTLDNVIEGPGPLEDFKFAGWTMPYADEEFIKFKHEELFKSDALLLGYNTYKIFAEARTAMEDAGDFGERMNSISKFVVSDMPEELEWENSKMITGDIKKGISELKKRAKNILVFGSGELVETLIGFDLVDEFRLLVYPIVLSEGMSLFKDETNIKLKLLEVKKFNTGVVLLRYSPIKK